MPYKYCTKLKSDGYRCEKPFYTKSIKSNRMYCDDCGLNSSRNVHAVTMRNQDRIDELDDIRTNKLPNLIQSIEQINQSLFDINERMKLMEIRLSQQDSKIDEVSLIADEKKSFYSLNKKVVRLQKRLEKLE